ncbi:L-threonylcarbamoyladenylate synthase [Bacillus sp. NPDC077027]|uniref:L-threonylcarbamoyladenylate synthase n=1 Tax=Bacillus sp. NPDC077027 TaxID=3390548 RepID=UPI003CFFC855
MKTKRWLVDLESDLSTYHPQIKQAAELLRKNEVVAFPTETVYGLGANAKEAEAVMKIYEAKGRPSDNPLIVHIADIEQLHAFAEVTNEKAQALMDAFWPGALTIVLPCKEGALSKQVTAGLSTVGVRMPDHPVALDLIRETGLPIAAPSANRSGKPSPTQAEHVVADLDGKIAGIVDGGPTGIGVESTVVSCIEDVPVILRPGGITKEALEQVVGEVKIDPGLTKKDEAPVSPGMKYAHYAPEAKMYIFYGNEVDMQTHIDQYRSNGSKVGVLTTEEKKDLFSADVVYSCGWRERPETIATNLYHVLRQFDGTDVDLIIAEGFSDKGVGAAIMNRLQKAAGGRILS